MLPFTPSPAAVLPLLNLLVPWLYLLLVSSSLLLLPGARGPLVESRPCNNCVVSWGVGGKSVGRG